MADGERERQAARRRDRPRDGEPARQHRRGHLVGARRRRVRAPGRSRSSTRPGFPVDFACEVKDFDVTDYIDYKASRRMDRFTHLALAAARQAEADAGLDIAAEPERDRRRRRHRDRRAQVVRGVHPAARRARPRPRQPVLDRADHPEPRRRLGLDGARDEGAAALRVHRLRRVEHGDRRRARRDPPGPRRRDDLRRHRGAGVARRDRRLRRDARDLAAQRRPEARLATVRRRARRVRDGRGRAR